jgi:surfeit locus 1 family protein
MPAGYSFRPRLWALALATAACVAGIALGNWQTGRAAEKRALAASQALTALRGSFETKYTVFIDNKLHHGRPGYHVVQPLRVAPGRHVLVNRGWVAAGPSRAQLPEVRTPAGEVSLQGLRLERFPRAYEPVEQKPEGPVWQNVTPARFAAASGLALEPWVFEQHSALDDGLAREWPRADAGVEKHESYALQWYSLAGLSIALLIGLNVRREQPKS